MNSLRTSIACLALAATTGAASFLPEGLLLGLQPAWNDALRLACVVGLVAFAVAFMVGLDRRSLLRD